MKINFQLQRPVTKWIHFVEFTSRVESKKCMNMQFFYQSLIFLSANTAPTAGTNTNAPHFAVSATVVTVHYRPSLITTKRASAIWQPLASVKRHLISRFQQRTEGKPIKLPTRARTSPHNCWFRDVTSPIRLISSASCSSCLEIPICSAPAVCAITTNPNGG